MKLNNYDSFYLLFILYRIVMIVFNKHLLLLCLYFIYGSIYFNIQRKYDVLRF